MIRNSLATAALATAALASLVALAPAHAQMSSDQIIRSLQPGTRGIRPVGPSDPGAQVPAPSAGPRAAAGAAGIPRTPPANTTQGTVNPTAPPVAPVSVNLTVQFATGSAELTPQAVRTLDELGRALSSTALAGYRFRIEGHTDTVGAPETNRVLSEARAARVLDYLASKWNVDRGKVQTAGVGQDQPLVPTGPNVPELRNRRVTVINLGT